MHVHATFAVAVSASVGVTVAWAIVYVIVGGVIVASVGVLIVGMGVLARGGGSGTGFEISCIDIGGAVVVGAVA